MELAVLIVILTFEAAFFAFCVITKNRQRLIRNYCRIGLGLLLGILLVGSVLKWGAKWYILIAISAVFIVIAVIELILHYNGRKEKVFVLWKSIVSTALIMILMTVSVLPAIAFPEYQPIAATGKYATKYEEFVFTDNERVETYAEGNSC